MLERRNDVRRPAARTASVAGICAAIGLRIWARAAQRPLDSLAMLVAAALSLVIVVNALFLQSGAHPAPFFANPSPAAATRANAGRKLAAPARTARASADVRAQTASTRRNDQIAELISSFVDSSRVMAVQRVLSDFGYGQIRPSGILDAATRTAIEKFEREHQMPVTGRISARLVSELAVMTGHPLDD